MSLIPSKKPLHVFTDTRKTKDEVAVDEMAFKFTSLLQTFLKNAGYTSNEIEIRHTNYLSFKYFVLYNLAQGLHSLKSELCHDISDQEKICLERLNTLSCLCKNDNKMNSATKITNSKLPHHFKQCMLQAGFILSETKEYHKSYLSFLTSFIIIETEKIFHFKNRSNFSKKLQTDSSCSQQLDCSPLYKSISCIDLTLEDNSLTTDSSSQQVDCATPKYESTNCIDLDLETDSQTSNSSSQHVDYATRYESMHFIDLTSNDESSEEPCQSTHSSMQILATTIKHCIYVIPSTKSIIKVLKSNNPLVKDVTNLDNEFKVTQVISHPAFRSSIKRTTIESMQALILEWAPGFPISDLKTVTVMDFLTIAREIVSSLLAIHKMQFMHANLTCEHIIFEMKSKSIKIIGCGSSTSFNSKKSYISNHELLEKDLRCISPEQTGRVNRDIDYRSDFYSLGIIFYRLLAGKFPFESKNALELLQLHICQDPLPVSTINHNIPIPLSDMISKLMEKNADDRYQSTKGIIHDLDLMISEYINDKNLGSIELVQHDISETLFIPQKLYGYSPNYNALLSVFDRVTSSFEVVFVSGDSGTGKSSLVFELYRPITKKNGIFISGKYNFCNTGPYSALLEAVNNFCDDLLLRDESTVNRFKSQIQNAIGDEGKILTDVITNLHLVIGEQPCAADAFGLDAKNRFIYVFIKFINAMCSVGFPIVLVLEDLQWMDIDSLGLLSALVTDKTIRNLMFVGIYRQNEVIDTHPVLCLLQHIEKAKRSLTQIKINNLVHESVNELISDTLCIPSHGSYALTAMIHEKTKGNPFFVKRMLKSLSEEGLIFFCNDVCRWKWDASIFGATNIYENVKELLRLKFLSFDEHTQQVLKVASCLGSSFSLRTLKLIVNRNDGIEGALSTGMITQYKGSHTRYHFVHDHIQEAASSLLPDDTKAIFLYIGKKLWKLFSKQELHENIFVIVHLLQNGIDIVQDQEERSQIAELFMEAGKEAVASTAFIQAFKYLEIGIQLLGQDCWTTHYSLSLNLHDVAAKTAYCTLNYGRMNLLLDQIFKNATSTLDLVQSYSLQINQFKEKRMFEDAINVGVCILDMLGEKLIDNQCQSIIDSEFVRIRCLISERSVEKMLQLKEMEDEVVLSIMMILNAMLVPCKFVNLQLFTTISTRIVQLTFSHGISKKYSPIGFNGFSQVLCEKGDSFAYQVGKLSLTLLKNTHVKESIPMIYIGFYAMVAPYFTSIHESIDPILKAYSISLEIGSHESGVICFNTYCIYSFLSGKPLANLLEDADDLMSVLPLKTKAFLCTHQAIHNLLNDTESSGLVKGKYFNSMRCFDTDAGGFDISRVSVISCLVAYLFQNYALTISFTNICRRHLKYIHATFLYPIFLFYDSLVSLEMARVNEHKQKWIKNAQENLMKLKHMSQNAPENFVNKIHLVEAEMALVLGNELEAISHYQKSIALSNKHCFPQEEALACERAGMYLWESGGFDIAPKLFLQAYKCYETWGAKSKMRQLEDKYPSLSHKFKNSSKFDNTELQVESQSQGSVSLLSDYTRLTKTASPKPKRKFSQTMC